MFRKKLSRSILQAALLVAGLLTMSPLSAEDIKTFRWSAGGDANTLEPYGIFEVPTLSFLDNIYEALVRRNKKMELEPSLATKWTQIEPTVWRFELRKNVVFHDGTPFTADDVLFSLKRGKGEGSDVANKLVSIKEGRKIDDYTVEFITDGVNPILPAEIAQWYIMSEKWCKANGAEWTANFRKKEENFATRNTNGTGPFKLVSRQHDVQTVLEVNDKWWDKPEFNFKKAIFTPIKAAQTRVAALLSDEVDVIFPVPLHDIDRVNNSPEHKVDEGIEYRTIFLGMNQWQDELPDSDIKGKNPFKDKRVRLAFYHAIDVDAIHKKVMRGASVPTGLMFAPGIDGFDPALNKRLPYDPEKSKKLLEEAGYKNGFRITMDVPNDRYVADEDIGKAVTAMLAKIGIKVSLNAKPKVQFFPKVLSRDTSFFIYGWTPMSLDAYDPLTTLIETVQGGSKGLFNLGKYSNPKVDELIEKIRVETNKERRNKMISEASRIHQEDVGHIPLHQQKLAWGRHKKIDYTQRGDDYFCLRWVSIK